VTRTELLDVIYRFYARDIYTSSPGYDDTPEQRRLVKAVRRAVMEYPEWKALARRLGDRYPLVNRSLHLLGGTLDAAYSAYVYVPGDRKLGFHVCFLGPYYGVHRTGHPSEEPTASDIVREIEATYVGYEPIPPELGDVVVPDVALDRVDFGNVTVYDCLLSTEWRDSSGPSPRPRGR
jgi:hypothetical protein